jgi:hypothetical protein
LQTGGAGTTEYLQLGAQSDGDGKHINGFPAPAAPDSDFMEININGDLLGSDGILFTTRGGVPLLDADFIENADPVFQNAFPRPTFLGEDRYTDVATKDAALPAPVPNGVPDGGAPAERWSVAEVSHVNGVTTFKFNGVEVATIANSDFGSDLGYMGIPWFGYTDFFNSVAGNDSSKVAQPGAPAAGDFNGNGVVDAADYTKWRDNLGAAIALPNETSTPGMVTVEDYNDWKAGFGSVGTAGMPFDPLNASYVIVDNVKIERIPAAGGGAAGVVPEPGSWLLLMLASYALVLARVQRRN